MEFGHFFKAARGRTGFSYLVFVGFGRIWSDWGVLEYAGRFQKARMGELLMLNCKLGKSAGTDGGWGKCGTRGIANWGKGVG